MLDTSFGVKWSTIQTLTDCDPGKPVDFTVPVSSTENDGGTSGFAVRIQHDDVDKVASIVRGP